MKTRTNSWVRGIIIAFCIAVLPVLLIGCGKTEPWVIKAEIKSADGSGNTTTLTSWFHWDPVQDELVAVIDDLNRHEGAKKVAEAGYKKVTGDFVNNPTAISMRVKDYKGWMEFRPYNALEGRVRLDSNMKAWSDYGEYKVTRHGEEDVNPATYLLNLRSPGEGIKVGIVSVFSYQDSYISDPSISGLVSYFDKANREGALGEQKISYYVDEVDRSDSRDVLLANLAECFSRLIEEQQVAMIVTAYGPSVEHEEIFDGSRIPCAGMYVNPLSPPSGEYTFATGYSSTAALIGANHAYHGLAARSAFVLADEADYYQRQADRFAEAFTANGGTVIGRDDEAQTVDVLFMAGRSSFVVDALRSNSRSSSATGVPKAALLMCSGKPWKYVDRYNWPGRKPLLTVQDYDDYASCSEAQELFERYDKMFGEPPNSQFTAGWETGAIVVDALKRAGASDKTAGGEKIRQALEQTNLKGVNGTFRFGDNHLPQKNWLVVSYQDGREQITDRINVEGKPVP